MGLETLNVETARVALLNHEVTSRDLTTGCLDRIKSLNDGLGAFLWFDEDLAMEQADASDARRVAGTQLGPLDGIPIALKDNFLTKGIPTTAASKILENFTPPYDGTATKRLKEAGAIMVGKLNCDEFAMGSSNENSAYGHCRNPWDKNKSPGGSSGGSAAAVAAGMVYAALGTDTGGSIRQPSAFCGTTGLKPSYGRVSRFGVVAFASSLDQVGPIAQDVTGCAHMLNAIAGFDPRDSTSLDAGVPDYTACLKEGLEGLTVGLPREYLDVDGLDPEVASAFTRVKEILISEGVTLKEISLAHTQYAVATYYVIATAEAASNLARYDGVRFGPRLGEEDGLATMYAKTRGSLFGDEVKRRIMLGNYVLSSGYYDAYYLRAQKVRQLIAQDFHHAFADVDLILCPTSPTPAFSLGAHTEDPLKMYLSDIFTISANLAGLAAINLNAGFTANGLPIGVQFMAPPLGEPNLLKGAYHLETALDLKDQRPNI
jgi:aspartyl-tRNA(Asn)/glutamyl-tRNA(Gln) amidotransferase subunit A